MGSPKPTVITPPPPVVYQSITPLESYQQLGDYFRRIKKQTNVEQENLYAQSGTPEEIGARQAAVRLKEAGAYLSSIPSGDKYAPFDSSAVTSASKDVFSQAQKDYSSALGRAQQGTAPAYTEKEIKQIPSWARSTIPAGMPPPPPAPAPAPTPSPTPGSFLELFLSGFKR